MPTLIEKLIIIKIIKDIKIRKPPNLILCYYSNRNWDKVSLYLIYFEIILNWRADK